MGLKLSIELREFIDGEIRAGRYATEEAAVADALLRMKEQRENESWMRAEVDKGMSSVEAGRTRVWDVEAAKQRLRDRLQREGKDG